MDMGVKDSSIAVVNLCSRVMRPRFLSLLCQSTHYTTMEKSPTLSELSVSYRWNRNNGTMSLTGLLWRVKLCLTPTKHSVNAYHCSLNWVNIKNNEKRKINNQGIISNCLWIVTNVWFFFLLFIFFSGLFKFPQSRCYSYQERKKVSLKMHSEI